MTADQYLRLELPANALLHAGAGGLHAARGMAEQHFRRRADFFVLFFVRQGVMPMREQDRALAPGAGQTLLLWPGREHEGTAPYSDDLVYFWVHFTLDGLDNGAPETSVNVPQLADVRDPDSLAALFRRYLDLGDVHRDGQPAANTLLMLILRQIAQHHGPSLSPSAMLLASRAQAFIDTHFVQPIGTATIAHYLNCNPTYLGRVYRQVYDQTVTHAIHARRLAEARRLLACSDAKLPEIARRCGFGSTNYLQQIFKQFEGTTPGHFRRSAHARASRSRLA